MQLDAQKKKVTQALESTQDNCLLNFKSKVIMKYKDERGKFDIKGDTRSRSYQLQNPEGKGDTFYEKAESLH